MPLGNLAEVGPCHEPPEDLAPLGGVELVASEAPDEKREQVVELVSEHPDQAGRQDGNDSAHDEGEGDSEEQGVGE